MTYTLKIIFINLLLIGLVCYGMLFCLSKIVDGYDNYLKDQETKKQLIIKLCNHNVSCLVEHLK